VPSSVRAMRAGAMNFLTKPVEAETLIGSVQEALHRGAFEQRRRTRRDIVLQRLETLTPRERQVFEAVVWGYLNKQIAASFGVGEKTIKVHRGRVMHKMQAKTLAQLVRMADGIRESAMSDDWEIEVNETFGHAVPSAIDTHRSWS
ncbi:MAG: LuxR C-terminal-related transcriptional regulator, partial [Steroidobacteraceae bacterium]